MLGQPLVDERVVGVQQIDHAAVFMHDAAEEQLGLLAHRLPQIVVEIRERSGHRAPGLQRAQVQPLPAKFVTSCSDRGSASMRSHLLFQHGGIVQFVLAGQR